MGMAKRSYSKKGRNIEPAVQTFTFKFDVPQKVGTVAGSTTQYIDLSQCASLVNRRFYRQGINWAVAGIKLCSTPGSGSVIAYKLPNTWVMSNSWMKGFKTWQKMIGEALQESSSVRPRFLDFKVYADNTHHQAGSAANLLPYQYAPVAGPMTAGEWSYSTVQVPIGDGLNSDAAQELDLIATGASFPGVSAATGNDGVSLIEGYAASRALPSRADPNTPGDADNTDGLTPENWMSALFNDGTQQMADVITDLQLENTIAPYPFENDGANTDTMYPGGQNQAAGLQLHDIDFISGTTIGGTTRLKGGNFPCGLLALFATNDSETALLSFTMTIDLVPGNHRGYLCEPMTEM
jgi:hypothetical protein